MIDAPKLGLNLLNGALHYLAETTEDSEEFEMSMSLVENLRKLVGRTRLRKGIAATCTSSADQVRREREVVHSLMEITEVARMGDE